MCDQLIAAVVAGFGAAAVTTPVGVSGAVFLLPLQVAGLGISPAVAGPTNLVFNLLTTPAAVWRARGRPRRGRLVAPVLAGAVPGMVLGMALRASGLIGDRPAAAVVVAVLIAMGAWLLFGRPWTRLGGADPAAAGLIAMASVAGIIGGIYGIGGGALVAPALVLAGVAVADAAPVALLTTLSSSLVGIAVAVAVGAGPDWVLGCALGLGGVAGAVVGMATVGRLPPTLLRRALGGLALVAALWHGLGT